MPSTARLIELAAGGHRPDPAEAMLLEQAPLASLMPAAEQLALAGFGRCVSYSRKVFIPLTKLCRDVCHYCTFARGPSKLEKPYLTPEQVIAIARAGAAAGCNEALFTLGDKPELRYGTARRVLAALGHATTIDYLESAARQVREQTGLLPHLNPGVLSRDDIQRLRPVSVSMGLMLETTSERLSQRGGSHWGSPDKLPARRLETIRAAGELAVPFTSGILIGIGETRRERIEAMLALRDLHDAYGHLQEIIIQNFRAKAGTRMAHVPEPSLDEHLWTIATARLLFGATMSIQAPPNLRPDALADLIGAGINDWGGVSPVTVDHVNPEAPWPQLAILEAETNAAGRELIERLAITPAYAQQLPKWVDPSLRSLVLRRSDSLGRARCDDWYAGSAAPIPPQAKHWVGAEDRIAASPAISRLIEKAECGERLDERGLVELFCAEGTDLRAVLRAADCLRAATVGDTVSYVVNRNINYTNICAYRCGFCAFSKGRSAHSLRGPAYLLDLHEIARRAAEAFDAGATEVCLQGGIHPAYSGNTYLDIVAAVKEAVPQIHVHAFSPLEIRHGATTLGLSLEAFLRKLKSAGLATLPGTAAEILDDEVRAVICPDKLVTAEWLDVMRMAHSVGLKTTATIMFGHVDHPRHWAKHLLRIRDLQQDTAGFTEFVSLPFVHMEAPLARRGLARLGPTFREALLMHAIARLALHPLIRNIQTSWVKMGPAGAALALRAGANDLGGTLMNESITRAAGGVNGQQMDETRMQSLALSIGRPAQQRTTLYDTTAREAVPIGRRQSVGTRGSVGG